METCGKGLSVSKQKRTRTTLSRPVAAQDSSKAKSLSFCGHSLKVRKSLDSGRIAKRHLPEAKLFQKPKDTWICSTIPSNRQLSIPNFFEQGIQIRQVVFSTQRLRTPDRSAPPRREEARNSFDASNCPKEAKDTKDTQPSFLIRRKTLSAHTASQPLSPPKPAAQPRKVYFVPARPRHSRKVERVPVKEAMRDKDWMQKAKPQLLRDFSTLLLKSNGLCVVPPAETYFTYKYFVGPGNNCALVKQVLSTRSWWSRVFDQEEAHVVWTQLKERELLRELPSLTGLEHEFDQNQQFIVSTAVKYIDPRNRSFCNTGKLVDISALGYALISSSPNYCVLKQSHSYESADLQCHNRLEGNHHNSNKKGLFYNLKAYFEAVGRDLFDVVPLTFHFVFGENDPSFQLFQEAYDRLNSDENGIRRSNFWILKPGENTNRGNGITVCENMEQIKKTLINNPFPSTGRHTYIIQKYIEEPFLVYRRKFDIRCFVLVTGFNGVLQGYFYSEGYLRTASKQYTVSNAANKFIHLTNDAVQQHSDDYGKFESGNKLSYNDFQRYLDANYSEGKVNFAEDIIPQMKAIVKDTIQAVYLKLDPAQRAHTFEIFGYDFILDSHLKAWLLEVNTNPCLELSSPILARIIPAMLDNAFRIAIDPLFPEPTNNKKPLSLDPLPENKFELLFHSLVDGPKLLEIVGAKRHLLEEIHPAIKEISEDEEEELDD